MITGIDHVAISVVDYPAALRQYTRMFGHAASAESSPALFSLSNARILLLEAASAADEIGALGLGTPDAVGCITRLHAQNIVPTALPERSAAQLWALPPESTRGLPVRIVERAVATLPAADSFSADQVEALDHLVVRSAAPDRAVAFYAGTLGMRLALDRELGGTRMLFFRSGGVTLEVIEDRNATAADVFYGIAYRVRDLQATHLRLTAAGMALTEPRPGRKAGTEVFSTRSSEGGVPMLFIRDPSRDKPEKSRA